MGSVGAVDAVLPARLPEDLVAAEEGEAGAGVARGGDVVALAGGPVLVVADRDEGVVFGDLGPEAVAVDPGEVADVVAVSLDEADQRRGGVEDPVLGGGAAAGEGAVVADLVGAAGRRPRVEAVAAVLVVGLPGGVVGLDEQVRVAVVVADDEDDVALPRRPVLPDEVGDVDARDRGGRDRPGGGLPPVAAVHQAGHRVVEAGGLYVGRRRGLNRIDQPGAVAAVVPQSVDLEAVVAGGRIDLEVDRLPLVDADLGGVPLNAGVAGAADVPLARRVAGLPVLADDLVVSREAVDGLGGTGVRAERDKHWDQQDRELAPPA